MVGQGVATLHCGDFSSVNRRAPTAYQLVPVGVTGASTPGA
jgi:hypothetical protein